MADWTTDDVIAIAPEFADVDPVILGRFVDDADAEINPRVFGASTKRAGTLLTAHLLALLLPAEQGGGLGDAGVIASESVGGISVSYAVPQAVTASALARSKYGAEFARLARARACGPWVV